MKKVFISIISAAMLLGCTSQQPKASNEEQPQQKQTETKPQKSYRFNAVQPPAFMGAEQQRAYMRDHFWDNFDFNDTLATTKADTVEMLRFYAAFVALYVEPLDQEPIRKLMERASVSKPMFDYFGMLADKVLHDPNSPYRNDEHYIAVLEAQIASSHYDEYEKMAPQYDLRVVSQNRIGHKANNFRYTDFSGRTRDMYSLGNDYIIVYINNPGCHMCRDITEELKRSTVITEMLKNGRLKILAIYPDEQLDEWHKHRSDIPSEWINGYDKGCLIGRENIYNVNAIPALYLLDRDKKVLVKDSTNVKELEAILLGKN
jgi:hypothetical protein